MYQGFYLNLDRNQDRRQAIERHLAQLGLQDRYKRFAAVDGKAVYSTVKTPLQPGALGLWLSHEQLLAANLNSPVHLHFIEDDIVFSKQAGPRFNALLKWLESTPLEWDLIYTEVGMPMDLDVFHEFARERHGFETQGSVKLVNLFDIRFSGTTSMFFNRRSIEKVYNLIRGKWSEPLPIDLHLRRLVQNKQITAHVLAPFLTSFGEQAVQSDIRGETDQSRRAMEIYRRAIFVEADLNALQAEAEEVNKGARVSTFADIYLKTLRFAHSDRYKPY